MNYYLFIIILLFFKLLFLLYFSYKLLFILHAKKDASLISINSICQLIKLQEYGILEKLLNFKYR